MIRFPACDATPSFKGGVLLRADARLLIVAKGKWPRKGGRSAFWQRHERPLYASAGRPTHGPEMRRT